MRLAEIDGAGVIVRCFYGTAEDLKRGALEAPLPWAREGAHYEDARLAYEQKVAEEQARMTAITGDAERLALLDKLRRATPAQISDYVDANVTDLASARALLKRILLVLAL